MNEIALLIRPVPLAIDKPTPVALKPDGPESVYAVESNEY